MKSSWLFAECRSWPKPNACTPWWYVPTKVGLGWHERSSNQKIWGCLSEIVKNTETPKRYWLVFCCCCCCFFVFFFFFTEPYDEHLRHFYMRAPPCKRKGSSTRCRVNKEISGHGKRKGPKPKSWVGKEGVRSNVTQRSGHPAHTHALLPL